MSREFSNPDVTIRASHVTSNGWGSLTKFIMRLLVALAPLSAWKFFQQSSGFPKSGVTLNIWGSFLKVLAKHING